MKQAVTRVNIIKGVPVVERFEYNIESDNEASGWWLCQKYEEPSTVMLSRYAYDTDAEAIATIKSQYNNIVYYGKVCKVEKILEVVKEDYVGFIYEDGYKYWVKKKFLEEKIPFLQKLYKKAKKKNEVIEKEKIE